MTKNPAIERIMDGATWADFCDALKRAGDVILREGSPRDPFDRAEGFRYLSRLTRVALESYIEFADPLAPVLPRPAGQTGYLEGKDPHLAPDGSFEIMLSCKQQSGNWLRMEPDTSSLIVRQTFQ